MCPLRVLKITELVLTLEGAAEGGGSQTQVWHLTEVLKNPKNWVKKPTLNCWLFVDFFMRTTWAFLEIIQKPGSRDFFNSETFGKLKNWNQRFYNSIFFPKTGIGCSAILFFFIKLELEVLLFLKFMRITSFFHHKFQNPGMRRFHNLKNIKELESEVLEFWNFP